MIYLIMPITTIILKKSSKACSFISNYKWVIKVYQLFLIQITYICLHTYCLYAYQTQSSREKINNEWFFKKKCNKYFLPILQKEKVTIMTCISF